MEELFVVCPGVGIRQAVMKEAQGGHGECRRSKERCIL